jgi:hypothetical protein
MRATYGVQPEAAADVIRNIGKVPLLLRAQPTHFAILKDPADLRAWEQNVKAELGMSLAATAESACESNNPSNDCDTD